MNSPSRLSTQIAELEHAQLVRRLPEAELAYLFKHALVQDTAYASLLKHERKRLHRAIGETLERDYADHLDEHAALLAQHFEVAEEYGKAFAYLNRAADWARRAAAPREEAQLLTRALALAAPAGAHEQLADLHARRGKAFANITRWPEAQAELLTALDLLTPEHVAERAVVLLELAVVTHWLWDEVGAAEYAKEALTLAEQVGRDDLAASAMISLAIVQVSDGETRAGINSSARAVARAGEHWTPALIQGMELGALALYWVGDYGEASARLRAAIQRAHQMYDTGTVTRGLADLGLALMGQGEYGAALGAFREAREYGQVHDVGAFLARSIAMEGGLHLELFDYGGAEAIAQEARRAGRAADFSPAIASAAIDLLLNFARRGDLRRADYYVSEVAEVIPKTYGSHRWLWGLRFAQARAELALASEQWQTALTLADEAIAQSRAVGRVKYETLGLITRGHAHAALGDRDAARIAARTAVQLARSISDPGLFLRAAAVRLTLDGDDRLAAEARATARRIAHTLPPGLLRECFEAITSELV
jgi:tetratricopeptide (TPR) repeat protein